VEAGSAKGIYVNSHVTAGHGPVAREPIGSRVANEFERRLGAPPSVVVRAPGRVNLIGDHTDYNDGFVLPIAIDRGAWIALRPRTDQRVVVHSMDFTEPADFDLREVDDRAASRGGGGGGGSWSEYVRGVGWSLATSGHRLARGWEGVAGGDVPIGAGLSSSAALELAVARAFAAVNELVWDAAEMARVAQRAENEWVGVNCGIMDQLIAASGIDGHALLIDCRSLETTPVPIPPDASVVVLDTATRRDLAESAYNECRARCEAAAAHFGVRALRDVKLTDLETCATDLDPTTRRRARHVITENARTIAAADALTRRDLRRVGALMGESHASLRDDFEVSSRELDVIVELASAHDGCYGARMTGAGFGGCAVALVEAKAAERFSRDVTQQYRDATRLDPRVYVCAASAGASVVTTSTT
jgi:galactokinase